jgi:Amt family ammonium transporter
MKKALGYDDSLDVFGVHGIGGITGAMLTGLVAAGFMGGAGINAGSVGAQIWAQTKGVVVTIIWSGVVSFVALKGIDIFIGIRAKEEDEVIGLDQTHHGESGYNF